MCNTFNHTQGGDSYMAAIYPDWVLAHKEKGTYINKAHSERIKGTNKVRRVCDGYLGRITEKDGLIPAGTHSKVSVTVFEVGLSFAILSTSGILLSGIKKSFPRHGEIIFACAVLLVIYGCYSEELYEGSYLKLHFNSPYPSSFTKSQIVGIERGERMLNEKLPKVFGEDYETIRLRFPDIRLIKIKNKYILSPLSGTVQSLSEKYNVKWEDPIWQS